MTITEHYHKNVATIAPAANAREAAELLERSGVGCLVVIGPGREPLGVLTDRDLALRVAGEGRDAAATPVSTVMSQPALTAEPGDPFSGLVERMREHGVRRLPVVEEGRLVGIVSLDDLLIALSRELGDLGETLRREIWRAGEGADVETAVHEITGALGWAPHGVVVPEEEG